MVSLVSSVLFAIQVLGLTNDGPLGISPKYSLTFSFAVSKSISPAKTSTALFGP